MAKTAKCYRQFKHRAVVAQMFRVTEDSSWATIRCTALVDKTIDKWKIDRRQSGQVCLAVEKATERSINNSMHTAMTEHKLNCNSWMKSNLQILQCRSKHNQWGRDRQLSVWISSTNKSHDLNLLCRQTVRWTQYKMMWELVVEVD